METNWSLIINIALLISVVFILIQTLRKKQDAILPMDSKKPALSVPSASDDDIISVRKIEPIDEEITISDTDLLLSKARPDEQKLLGKTVMLFLLAKAGRHLAGYEMLQAILETGLRFGEDLLFHYYESPSSQSPILFSLAAATKNGTFDMQNIGAFNAKGLCLFMYQSQNLATDEERLKKMIGVAEQLAEGLDAILLDDSRKPFTQETNDQYYEKLNLYETKIPG